MLDNCVEKAKESRFYVLYNPQSNKQLPLAILNITETFSGNLGHILAGSCSSGSVMVQ